MNSTAKENVEGTAKVKKGERECNKVFLFDLKIQRNQFI